jgi:rhodanese-related sulfurtransferase
MARRRGARPSRTWAIATLLGAGAAGGLLYNVLAPRGIFAPEPAVASAPVQTAADHGRPPAAGHPARPRAVKAPAVIAPVPAVTATPAAAPAGPYAPLVLSLDQAATLYREGAAVWVDARSPEVYAFGHVPGALNLPYLDPEAGFAKLAGRLPKTGRIVVYCTSGECDEADHVLAMLASHGYRNLSHFKEGWNVWEITDLPQKKGPLP